MYLILKELTPLPKPPPILDTNSRHDNTDAIQSSEFLCAFLATSFSVCWVEWEDAMDKWWWRRRRSSVVQPFCVESYKKNCNTDWYMIIWMDWDLYNVHVYYGGIYTVIVKCLKKWFWRRRRRTSTKTALRSLRF